jgi:CelD/BcsL family acetyltransferase involved in cellulose biosynthesis
MDRGRTEVITDRATLRSYEAEWRELAEQRNNAFVTPEWFQAWLDNYGESSDLAVLASRRTDGSLFGLLPFVIARERRPRSLRFAGAAHADHLHPVCRQEDEEALAAAVLTAMAESGERWRIAVLDNVDTGAQWWRVLADAPSVVGAVAHREAILPAIDLAGTEWDAYLASRGRNFRDQARRYPRRLERRHRVAYRRTAEASELDRDMATFFRLHDARWNPRGGSSVASRRSRAFHLDFAHAALRRGWLRLWLLELDGVAVAAWYGWRLGERYAYYQAGFDPAWSHLGVGFVLMVHTVRNAMEEGAAYYDMLLGDEPYKGRFATSSGQVQTVTLSRTRSTHLATAAEACMWKSSRRLPPGLRSLPPAISGLLPTARRR